MRQELGLGRALNNLALSVDINCTTKELGLGLLLGLSELLLGLSELLLGLSELLLGLSKLLLR